MSAPEGAASEQRSEEELREAYEAELARITTTDMMAQATVSLLNIGARRMGPPPSGEGGQRDLEQVRDAIDAARALLGILERRIPQELGPLREALSQLQMAYAREVQAAGGTGEGAAAEHAPPAGEEAPAAASEQPGEPKQGEQQRRPGPAEASGRLWVPGR